MELVPSCHSLPEESQGTRGHGRAGTVAAEERLLGWSEGEERGVPSVPAGEEGVTAGTEDELGARAEAEAAAAELQGVGLLVYPGCWGLGTGERNGWERQRVKGRDVGLGRGEEAGPADCGGEAE